MASIRSAKLSSHGSSQSSERHETKKYLLLRDTVAKSRWPHGASSRSRLTAKRSEQRVLKGSLWQEMDDNPFNQNAITPSVSRTLSRSGSMGVSSPTSLFKQCLESIEIEDLTLQCASAYLAEISDDTCRLLLAIPTSEERFYVHSDHERMSHARFINVGSDVIVCKRNIKPCRGIVRWKGRLAPKQGVWFGVEIMDEQSKGSGDSDGSVNNIRLFECDKNNAMFVNIAQVTLVPPKRPVRKPKKKAPSTPSHGSEHNMTNGSQSSDQYLNDLVSQTESELSFMDDVTSAETAPLVDFQVNDRVAWPPPTGGYEKGFVRWIGMVDEEDEILVGVEFDNPIGKGTGMYQNKRLFEARRGHASLVPLEGLVRISYSSSSLRDHSSASSQQSLMTRSRPNTGGDSLAAEHNSAADVLEYLGIDDDEPKVSDLNNNGRNHQERTLSSSKNSMSPRNPTGRRGGPPSPNGYSLNGSANRSTSSHNSLSSSDNLQMCDSVPYQLPPPPNRTASPTMVASDTLLTTNHSTDRIDSNGWLDSEDLSPQRSKPSKASPLSASEASPLASYHIPKLHSGRPTFPHRNKSKNRNGLVKLNSVCVKDMHDIVDELSLNSSPNESIVSLPEASDSQGQTDSNVDATDDVHRSPLSDPQQEHRQYALDKMSSQSQNSSRGVDANHSRSSSSSSSSQSSEEGSYSPAAEGILSPLTERTTPVSHSSFDNQTDTSVLNSDITEMPAPLTDSIALSEEPSFSTVPDPPPEFMGDSEPLDSNYTGLWKGLSGPHSNKSDFMEAVLFMLSLSTDILNAEDQRSYYPQLKDYLFNNIVYPLQSGKFVEASVMVKWRQQLDEISTGQLLSTGEMRELHKFFTLLLQHICNIHPLFELNNQQSGYALSLVAYNDARIGFPTVQKLLEKTCTQRQIKLNKVPNDLILILPRWALNKARIFPNLHIDLTNVLEYARRICHMCGGQAVFECPECYEHETTDLCAAAFCEPCSQTVHKHVKRVDHMPVQLKVVTQMGDEENSILILKGVLSVQNNHYVALSAPPRTSGDKDSRGTVPNADWLYFDSKIIQKDMTVPGSKYNIPEVVGVPTVTDWLSMDAYEQMARDMDSVPANIQRILEECCMCLYSSS